MRTAWAILAGLALGGGLAWWLGRDPPGGQPPSQRAAPTPRTDDGHAGALYRWRDDAGTLQVTDTPPRGRRYERIDREPQPGIRVENVP